MEYRNLGNSGLQVSVVGLGCNNFGGRMDQQATAAVVNQSLDLGINLFDTANSYGGGGKSEEMLGKALGPRRHDVVVATKFASKMGEGPMQSGGSRRHIMTMVEDSLRRLDTDYIDLYQVHFPDAKTPLDETMRALDDLVTQGKVRYIGHSNFAGWQVAEAHYLAEKHHLTPFISAQNHYNMLQRDIQAELIPACTKFGVGILPYFPLASGFLTGKYRPGQPPPEGTRLAAWPAADRFLNDRNFELLGKLEAFADARGKTILDLAFAWLTSQPVVSSVIAGATKIEQVEANVSASGWPLTPGEMAEVEAILG